MRKPNGESKGFGFVCYKTAEAALSAIDAMHNATLGTQQLYVGFAQDKNQRKTALKKDFIHHKTLLQEQNKNKNLYIKNLDADVNDQHLYDAFQGFGEITSAKVGFLQ